MCTVSYIGTSTEIIITSNRDERSARPVALPPEIYSVETKRLLYPKDPLGGGSWFTADQFGNAAVLLNGATEKHLPALHYRKSRGLILTEIAAAPSPIDHWKRIVLKGIEPLTIILLNNKKLSQLSWNGSRKNTITLETKRNYLWSSVTLYSEEIRRRREKWFRDFLSGKSMISAGEMLLFHSSTGKDDPQNGLMMNRDNALRTVSITQTRIDQERVLMTYLQIQPPTEFSKIMAVCP